MPPAVEVLSTYLLLCTLLVAAVALGREDTGTVVGWFRAGVLLAALGLRARVTQDLEGGELFGTGGSIGLHATLLSLGAVVLATAWWTSRRAEQRDPSPSTRVAVELGLTTGLLVAAGLAVAGLLSHLEGSALGSADDGSQHASAASLLLNGAVLVGGAAVLGRLSPRTSVRGWLEVQTRGYLVWARSALQHALLSGVLLALAGVTSLVLSPRHEVAIVDDETGSTLGTVVGALVLLPNAMLAAAGLFMGFGIGDGLLGLPATLTVTDLPARHWLWSLAPLAAALVVGVRRALATRADAALLSNALPAGLGSVVVWLGLGFLLRVDTGTGLGGRVGVSFTTSSLLVGGFAWGVGTLVLGRLAARPFGVVAPKTAARLRSGVPTGGDPPRRLSRRTTAVLVIGGLAVAVATAGHQVVQNALYSPRGTVESYLEALEAGDVEAALDTMRVTGSTDLLRPGVLPAGHRITGARVDDVSRRGDLATVRASFRVAGATRTMSLSLVQDGHRAGLFTSWVITNGTGRLTIGSGSSDDALAVNGVPVGSSRLQGVALLPGSYDITVVGRPYLTFGRDGPVVVSNESTVSLGPVALTSDATERARAAARAWLADCLAGATTLTTSCGATAFAYAGRVEGIRWSVGDDASLTSRWDGERHQVRVLGGITAVVTGTSVSSDFLGEPVRQPYRSTAFVTLDGTVEFTQTAATFSPS